MADFSGSQPHSSQGSGLVTSPKMPGALPNGIPPQWSQPQDVKPIVTSQLVPPMNATNGTRGALHLSQRDSLSSHSSRDSSPASSRVGGPAPSGMWPQNSVNHIDHNSVGSSRYPPLQPPLSAPQTQPIASFPSSAPANQKFSTGQRMVPFGLPSQGHQQGHPVPTSTGPPTSQDSQSFPTQSRPPVSVGNMPPSSYGQSLQQTSTSSVNAQGFYSAPQSYGPSSGPPLPSMSSTSPSQPSQAAGSAPTRPSFVSQLPPVSTYGSQTSQSNLQSSQAAGHTPQQPFAGAVGQARPPRQMAPGPFPMGLGPPGQVPPGQVPVGQVPSGQLPPGQLPPGQMPQGQLPPGQMPSGQLPLGQLPPGQMPPGQLPPGQMPPGQLASGQMPSGQLPQSQVPPGPMPPGQLPPGRMPLGQMPSGQMSPRQMSSGQMPPGPLPPGMMPPSQMPPGQNPRAQMPPRQAPLGHSFTGQLPSSQGQIGLAPANLRPQVQATSPSQVPANQIPQGQTSLNQTHPSLNSMSLSGPPSTSNYSQFNSVLSGPQRPPQPMNQNTTAPNQSVPRPSPGQYMPGHPPQHITAQPQFNVNDGHHMNKRYPQHPTYQMAPESLAQPMGNLSVTQQGYNRLWGQEHHDLLQSRNILPPEKIPAPKVTLLADLQTSANCSPDVFRCTLSKIPETDSLLKKSRLPLGVLIHPYRDLNNLPVIQCSTIVRCRTCRAYINPFVYFMDEKHWKCNLCFRVNELPHEFQFDPVTKTYGEPTRRPEIKSATIEFIAPAEYMLRPPQPAVYLFLLDVSRLAVECGYLQLICERLLTELDNLPGDSRTSVGFITFDSAVHFYSLAEGLSAPQQMVVMDIDDIFLPCPENLLANLGERRELIRDLLNLLPTKFSESYDTGSALGAALQAAYKLMGPTGGRVTVFQCCLPNKGPGSLKAREDPANRAGKDVPHLNPATDFYKQLALEFSGQQVAVDLFLLNQQYSDLATISGVSRFSGGCIYHFPLFQSSNNQLSDSLEHAFHRYLIRKIGFEAVMRIRCSRGLSIHTFHGNFFVRSTDLLSLPNINPDAGFGMQVSIEENLCDMSAVCFQAALLYTSSKGERRIRVHTLCLPIASSLPDILHAADQQCIIGLLAKMAVDRSQQSSVSDARDAFVNVVIDALSAYKLTQSSAPSAGLLAPHSLRLLPLYILALLKYMAFRSGTNTKLDDRVFAMCLMKTLPLANLIQFIYPDMYPVHCLDQYEEISVEKITTPMPPRLHLSAEKVDSHGAYLMDAGDQIFILICRGISPVFCENVLGVSSFNAIPEDLFELPVLDGEDSRKVRAFLAYLQSEKPHCSTLHVIREDSKFRWKFFERLIEDRSEATLSYYEFLQHIKSQVK